jgi:cytochrome o ubiquinol oxidase subunit 2
LRGYTGNGWPCLPVPSINPNLVSNGADTLVLILQSIKRVSTAVFLALPLWGCGGVLDPRGPIGASEKLILIDSVAIMLAIVVPVILATLGFAWWFRASNRRATYRANWAFSGHLELIIWAIPALVITFLGGIAWFGSHSLDPYQPLSKGNPIEIEVISLNWKWLFLYRDARIATVNQLIIPVGVPVHFRLTSSGVMNSFFVPQLGSQIYTMAGMTSQLTLQADKPGRYAGLSAQFSGKGFADMHFVVDAVTAPVYENWVSARQRTGPVLDGVAYSFLEKPSENVAPIFYRAVDPALFADVVAGSATPAASLPTRDGR